jgi:hypothetical protein
MKKMQLKSIISEVLRETRLELLKTKLRNIIVESLEEIKSENDETIASEMEEINKLIKAKLKDCELARGDDKNYHLNGEFPHQLCIIPQSQGMYAIQYIKHGTERVKKLNQKLEDLKKFIEEILKDKSVSYVLKAQNKAVENNNDKTEKSGNPRADIVKKKEIKDTKNENKDYTEQGVKREEDMPEKPYRDATKYKKQLDHPVKGTKPEYTYPKQKDKKLTVKARTYNGKGRKTGPAK